jgi:Xaa-Pro dipeptidase
MDTRLAKLTEGMRRHGFQAVAIMPGANLRYLTGLQMALGKRITLACFPLAGQPSMVLPTMEALQVEQTSRLPLRLYTWADGEGPQAALRRCLEDLELNGCTVAVEYTTMRVLELRALQQASPGVRDADATDLMGELRMAKDAEELRLMREAVRIVEAALRQTINQIRPGVTTERQLAAIWEQAMRDEGAEGPSFDTSVAAGPNGASPHHHNSERPVQPGDLLVMDGGARYGGYASDITRTIGIGPLSSEARDIYAAVLAGNQAGRAAAGPGVSGAVIDQAARDTITRLGYGEFFLHRTGHGLGLEIHEPPYIVAGSDAPLPVGATFTVEPGIYIAGMGGVRIEDDLVITEQGAESLTSFPRELIEL